MEINTRVPNNIIDYLKNSVEQFPDKTAIADEKLGKVTYKELDNISRCIASSIIEKSDCYNNPIIVYMDKSLYEIASFYGVVYSGNYYVPIDISMPIKRVEKIVKDLNPKLIITDKNNADSVKKLNIENVLVVDENIKNKDASNILIEEKLSKVLDKNPLYIIYTSGSTGKPKGVIISHRAVIDLAEDASRVLKLSSDNIFLSQAPFHFDASVPDIYCTLRNSATLHIISKQSFQNPMKVLKYIESEKINSIFWVPSALIMIANSRLLRRFNLSSLKKIMFCGETMPVKQLNIWREYVPDAMYVNYYGPTETTYACSYYIVDRKFENSEKLPIGHACGNTEILLFNENNKLVEGSEVGEICVRGTCLSDGYYNDVEKTEKSFIQNPLIKGYEDKIYKTGDLGYYNSFGELEFVSRKDFQIKRNGYRIEMGEIETAISSVNKIKNCCCLFDEDKNKIYAFYEADCEIDLYEELKNTLPEYMYPNNFILLESMPINSNGKVDRKKLKEMCE